LIENDFILHSLLFYLYQNKEFKRKYAFKGGTCLIKCYLGYYRFSEDLDFTYINQNKFKGLSKKKARQKISQELDRIVKSLELFCEKNGFDFKPNKANKRYFEFGAGNTLTTIKLFYKSIETGFEQFIKLQFNFVEMLCFPILELDAKTIVNVQEYPEMKVLFPEEDLRFVRPVSLTSYNLKEILVEKVRAILTREVVKSRDFLDVYMIKNVKGLSFYELKKDIIEKTKFVLRYQKYLRNLKSHIEHKIEYNIGDERNLLLDKSLPNFDVFIKEFREFIDRIILEILT